MVSYSPISRYPPKPSACPFTATLVISPMVTGMFILVGSSITEVMLWIMVSFCISIRNSRSMLNSKNSHSTPMVMEKQKATSETYTGESSNLILLLRFRISISAKPVAAHKKPVVVCRIESQLG